MRAFLVRLPSGARYWTALDEDLAVVAEAHAFLRHVRFGRDGSEMTTRSYAGGIALFLRWCGPYQPALASRRGVAGVVHHVAAARLTASQRRPRGGGWAGAGGSGCGTGA